MRNSRSSKKKSAVSLTLAIILSAAVFFNSSQTQAAPFVPNPQTAYAADFLTKCENQGWFIEEIERQLNIHEKTINTLSSQSDLDLIVTLGLTEKGIIGKIPIAIGEVKKLKYLYLSKNNISGTIPDQIYTLPDLQIMELSQNNLTGTLSSDVSKLTNLTNLSLWSNGLTGTIPPQLGTLTSLVNLDLSKNRFTGGIPTELTNLTNLKLLSLSENALGGTIPANIGDLSNLEVLLLYNCNLTGEIPTSLPSITTMKLLDLSLNNLDGNAFPAGFENMTDARRISLSNNKLTGQIPANIGNMTRLEIFDISINNISGTIPPSINNLHDLTKFVINDNQITGTIPSDLSGMTSLEEFIISQNQISGIIPDTFASMPKLKKAYLDSNLLTGILPNSLYAKRLTADINAEHNYLTGTNMTAITKNKNNFVDGRTNDQNRLYLDEYIKVNIGQEINIYDLFKTLDAADKTESGKAKLPPDAYSCILINPRPDIGEYIGFVTDGTGFKITVLQEIPQKEAIEFEFMIINNNGSAFSTIRFKINTEVNIAAKVPDVPVGGIGGGGGGFLFLQDPDEEDEDIEEDAYGLGTIHSPYIFGYEDGAFRPNGRLTRGEAAVIIYRISEYPDKTAFKLESSPFPDVDQGRWSAKEIAYLVEKGVFTGYEDGNFKPAAYLNRAEFVAIISRYMRLSIEAENTFTDIEHSWAKPYILRVLYRGYVTGYEDHTFRPLNNITRAEAVSIINRMLARVPKEGHLKNINVNEFSDVTQSHWAFEQILEASVEHYAN